MRICYDLWYNHFSPWFQEHRLSTNEYESDTNTFSSEYVRTACSRETVLVPSPRVISIKCSGLFSDFRPNTKGSPVINQSCSFPCSFAYASTILIACFRFDTRVGGGFQTQLQHEWNDSSLKLVQILWKKDEFHLNGFGTILGIQVIPSRNKECGRELSRSLTNSMTTTSIWAMKTTKAETLEHPPRTRCAWSNRNYKSRVFVFCWGIDIRKRWLSFVRNYAMRKRVRRSLFTTTTIWYKKRPMRFLPSLRKFKRCDFSNPVIA